MSDPQSNSGIPLRPSYTAVAGGDTESGVENTGEFPFTRGIHPEMYRKHLWMPRQFSGFGLPSDTNERARLMINSGQQYLGSAVVNAIGDIPSQIGIDSDDPRARYDVGKCGVAIDTIDDMSELLKGFDLTRTSVLFPFCGNAHSVAAMLLGVAVQRGVAEENVMGAAINNAFDNSLTLKHHNCSFDGQLRLCLDLIDYASRRMPKFSPIVFGESTHREMGAPADKAAAYALATGVAYTEALLGRGLDIDDFAPHFAFYMNTGNDFFEEIAKYRATRRIWAHLMKERFGAKDPASCKARITVRTTGLDMTPQEPMNNVIRHTVHALASVLGGVQAMSVVPYDEPIAVPTEESQLLALRVHEILAHETNVRYVADPLGGSFLLESLTNEMAARVRAEIKEIEDLLPSERARPGFRMFDSVTYGIKSGILGRQLDEWGVARQKAIERGEKRVVGVNYSVKGSWEPAPVWRVDPRVREVKTKMLQDFRKNRDGAAVKRALQRLEESARSDENLIPVLRDAYLAKATMGETTAVLIEAFGPYVPAEAFSR